LNPSAAKAEVNRKKILSAMLLVVSDDENPEDSAITVYFRKVCH
jgi:hypothetical protein